MVWERHRLEDLGKQSWTAHRGRGPGRLAPRSAVAGAGSCPPQERATEVHRLGPIKGGSQRTGPQRTEPLGDELGPRSPLGSSDLRRGHQSRPRQGLCHLGMGSPADGQQRHAQAASRHQTGSPPPRDGSAWRLLGTCSEDEAEVMRPQNQHRDARRSFLLKCQDLEATKGAFPKVTDH